ncbi:MULTISPECIES: hypothetical protein [unclassified Streptomyces]|uniref:hypothetical protein n=1 Tax=unclassified Streptomyces TaxID=2593676 RepID=UPI00279525FB|nr:hypothetical protein [Streptomyces sp. KL115B]
MTREINLDVHLTTEGAVYTCLGIGALLAAALPRLLSRLPMSVELLVAEVLAPTAPVLASEARVGEPSAEKRDEDEVRFALTSEAGLNDGLAALALAAAGNSRTGGWMVHRSGATCSYGPPWAWRRASPPVSRWAGCSSGPGRNRCGSPSRARVSLARLLMALLLFAVGVYVASGGLAALTWKGAAVGVLLHLLVRSAPVRGRAGRHGTPRGPDRR